MVGKNKRGKERTSKMPGCRKLSLGSAYGGDTSVFKSGHTCSTATANTGGRGTGNNRAGDNSVNITGTGCTGGTVVSDTKKSGTIDTTNAGIIGVGITGKSGTEITGFIGSRNTGFSGTGARSLSASPAARYDRDEVAPLIPKTGSAGSSPRPSPNREFLGDVWQAKTERSASINMTPTAPDLAPLIPRPGMRSRRKDVPRYVPTDWDDSLPYGGKVYLARKKKPDTWLCIALQVFVVALAVGLMYYAWFHTEHMHYHATKLYAHLGHVGAQAITAQKLLHGKGVARNHSAAMAWFKLAADSGHPHSSYNLAIGHLQGLSVGLQPGEAHDLIRHAASNGVPEAVDVLNNLCARGKCDN